MSKSLSLFFACASVALMLATAFSISENGWLAALFGLLTLAVIGWGFTLKARRSRQAPRG
ncbi:DUF5325 family protein [Cohnella sp. GCM10027633]|uniref:DUF5325 family protein n=1 Tax=unclassified Cohnella TaxID=2636738 RepID=UPI003624D84F